MQTSIIGGVAVVQSQSPLITDAQSALDLMASIRYEHHVTNIAIDKAAFSDAFFVLSTGMAGEILQKFVTYQMKLAIIGDYSNYTSKPLRDFMYESNKGSHIFFVATRDEAIAKLTGVAADQRNGDR